MQVVHDNRYILERIRLWPGRAPLRADWEGLADASRICLDRRAAGVARYSDTRCYMSVLCPPTRLYLFIPPTCDRLPSPVQSSLIRPLLLPDGEPHVVGIMSRYRFFAKLANGLGVKQRPPIPLSESLGAPGPQTSHSTSSWSKPQSCRISLLQFLNSQMNSSFPFSPTSPQTPVDMRGSTFNTSWTPEITIDGGWRSCSR
jgi:hypothetical protein